MGNDPDSILLVSRQRRPLHKQLKLIGISLVLSCIAFGLWFNATESVQTRSQRFQRIPLNAAHSLERCRSIKLSPRDRDFSLYHREESERFVKDTPPVLLKNASVWSGGIIHRGVDLMLDKGLIKKVERNLKVEDTVNVMHLDGAWVTPGIVDLHSHLGVFPSPGLQATAMDGNSPKGPILPWLRALDSLNTHDDAFPIAVAGGTTTSLVLPGSANAIGGQAFPIKLRHTVDRTPSSMLVELLGNDTDLPRWRYLKQACGENPGRVYKGSRMDTYWAIREAYNTARQIRDKQDEFCTLAEQGIWKDGEFPESLQWEALVDVLRGKVKVHNHCYEAVDIDSMVRITNEFKFSIAAFHHAHEAYLVPNTLKKAYGGPAAVALFATNRGYKREAFRGSEYAPKILADQGIDVVLKSDHPGVNSRYLLHEAQQAHYYGLEDDLALASVTSIPARLMGLDHRIGHVKEGFDADVVVWDSHPLTLGATPLQVYIDGIAQLEAPTTTLRPLKYQSAPATPDFRKEAKDAVKYDGLPPLRPRQAKNVLFSNVKNIWERDGESRRVILRATADDGKSSKNNLLSVLVQDGSVTCVGIDCDQTSIGRDGVEVIDLQGGSLNPSLTTFGSGIGLGEIRAEPSTIDGTVKDALSGPIPSIMGGDGTIIHAIDGLVFDTRDMLIAYSAGIPHAVTVPSHAGMIAGLGVAIHLAGSHKLEKGAILQNITALHVDIYSGGGISVSSQIATLRNLLNGGGEGELAKWFGSVAQGVTTLVIGVEHADIIASLLALKNEIEGKFDTRIRMTISGGTESHLLAPDLAKANVGVILRPSRPFPSSWDQRRVMLGPPLSAKSAIAHLLAHNITVGIGTAGLGGSRNVRFDIGWAAIEARGEISKEQAFALGSTALENLLGIKQEKGTTRDIVATRGGDLFEFESKVVAVISSGREVVDIL